MKKCLRIPLRDMNTSQKQLKRWFVLVPILGGKRQHYPPCSVPAQSASNRIGISVSYHFVGFDPAALPHLLPYTPGDYIASARKNGYDDSRAFLFDGTGRERPLGLMFALLVVSHCCQHRIETEVARFFISSTG
jgi:hypothetical protein